MIIRKLERENIVDFKNFVFCRYNSIFFSKSYATETYVFDTLSFRTDENIPNQKKDYN